MIGDGGHLLCRRRERTIKKIRGRIIKCAPTTPMTIPAICIDDKLRVPAVLVVISSKFVS
jgi:hypothetical protein